MSSQFVVPTVASAIDMVVHLGIDAAGRRVTREIVALPGRVEGGTIESSTIFRQVGGRLVRGDGFPGAPERFASAGIDVARLLQAPA